MPKRDISSCFNLRFFTDLHGSQICFDKILEEVRSQKPFPIDVLILGGDLVGKLVVPLERVENTVRYSFEGSAEEVMRHEEATIVRQLAGKGAYGWPCSSAQHAQFKLDKSFRRKLLAKLSGERLQAWMDQLAEIVVKEGGPVTIVNLGNDDLDSHANLIRRHAVLHYGDDGVVVLPNGVSVVSMGHSSPTPFKTEREASEQTLMDLITAAVANCPDPRRAIFNFHCPPKDSGLDAAPALDDELRPIPGKTVAAGSESVRQAIEVYQPLLGLHGHIHEVSARTFVANVPCFNPGSRYRVGELTGVFAIICDGQLKDALITNPEIIEMLVNPGTDRIPSAVRWIGKLCGWW